jgi:hypothetical protein
LIISKRAIPQDFLAGFPSVKREQVIAVLEASRQQVLEAA